MTIRTLTTALTAAAALAAPTPATAAAHHHHHHRAHHHTQWVTATSAPHASALTDITYTARPRVDLIKAAVYAAEAHWGGPPPCGNPTIEPVADYSPTDPGHIPGEYITAEATESQCLITLSNRVYPTQTAIAQAWPVFCWVMTHEVRHLYGFGHSTDPADPMYPSFNAKSTMTPECVAAGAMAIESIS